MYGVGDITGAQLMAEIGDVRRFTNRGALIAFAGVDPTMKQSGDFTGSRARMRGRGSPYLRRALWLASTVAAFRDPAISVFYLKKTR